MDKSDLYDHEVAAIGKAWVALQTKWSSKPNTRANLEEFAKEAQDMFVRMGFVVDIKWENNLIIDPVTMKPHPIEIEVIGRVPGTEYTEEGIGLYDHERQRFEVLNANARGEKFYGEKEKPK